MQKKSKIDLKMQKMQKMQKCKKCKKCKNAKMQKCKNAKMQKCKIPSAFFYWIFFFSNEYRESDL